MPRRIPTLPATVWLVGLISLCNDSASEMLYPLVPLYLSSVLMAGPKTLGLIEGIAEATAALLRLVSGVLVDRSGRVRSWLVAGYGIAGLGRPLIAFAGSWPAVMAIRFADRLGKGLRTSPRDALLAAAVSPDRRGLAFGVHRALDNAGAVIGPLLAVLFLGLGWTLHSIFLAAFIPGFLTLALALAVREPARMAPLAGEAFTWRWHGLPGRFKRYLLAVGLFALGNSSNMFLLLRAAELGVPEYRVPLLWMLVSLTAALFSTPLSAMSDRVGRRRLIAFGWGLYTLFYLGLGLAGTESWPLYLLFFGYGLFLAATEGAEKALVADLVPARIAGTAYGWFNLVCAALLLPASILFGWLYQKTGPLSAFAFSGGCAALSLLLLSFWVFAPSAQKARKNR